MLFEDDITPHFQELYEILSELDSQYPDSAIVSQIRSTIEDLEDTVYDITQRLFYGN